MNAINHPITNGMKYTMNFTPTHKNSTVKRVLKRSDIYNETSVKVEKQKETVHKK